MTQLIFIAARFFLLMIGTAPSFPFPRMSLRSTQHRSLSSEQIMTMENYSRWQIVVKPPEIQFAEAGNQN